MAGLKFRQQGPALLAKTPAIGKPLAPVSVIPCKGDDGRLLENLSTLVRQDYPEAAEFVLATARKEDPAQNVFLHLSAQCPEIRIKTVVAGISPTGSEKNNNLLKAVAASDPCSRFLCFSMPMGKPILSSCENSCQD